MDRVRFWQKLPWYNIQMFSIAVLIALVWMFVYNICIAVPYPLWFPELIFAYMFADWGNVFNHPFNKFFLDHRFIMLGYTALFDSAILIYFRFLNTQMLSFPYVRRLTKRAFMCFVCVMSLYIMMFVFAYPTIQTDHVRYVLVAMLHMFFLIIVILKAISYVHLPQPIVPHDSAGTLRLIVNT